MAVAVPVSLSASERIPAFLSGSGEVTINGSSAQRGAALYVGDRIATGDNSTATVNLKGTVITAPSHSSVIYRGTDVELGYGTVVVNTQSAVKGHLQNLTIIPSGAKARFELTDTKQATTVAALEGAVEITDGVHSLTLPAGQMLMRAAMITSDDMDSGGLPKGAVPETPHRRRRIPGWILWSGAAGAALGGLTAAEAGGSARPSPSKP
jgi:hypothetical protein